MRGLVRIGISQRFKDGRGLAVSLLRFRSSAGGAQQVPQLPVRIGLPLAIQRVARVVDFQLLKESHGLAKGLFRFAESGVVIQSHAPSAQHTSLELAILDLGRVVGGQLLVDFKCQADSFRRLLALTGLF